MGGGEYGGCRAPALESDFLIVGSHFQQMATQLVILKASFLSHTMWIIIISL